MFQRRREGKNMDTQKKEILEAAGYNFDSELLCFVNRKAGKIFSATWIDEKNVNTVRITLSCLTTPAPGNFF